MAYIRKVTCEEGRSTGLRMFDVKNECLQYQVMCDKCLDVAGLTYKGINMNFLSKPGLQGRNHYDTFREEPLMLLYHINLGYPFLTPATKLYIPTKKWHHETKLPPDTRQIMTTWTGRKRMSRSMCLSTISRRQRIREPGSLR